MGNSCMGVDRINNSLNTSWNNRTRVVYTISHSIASSYLDRELILFHQLHQFQAERHYITINVGSGNILQMASDADPLFQAVPNHAQIMFHGLFSGHFQFQENMIIRTAYQNSGFRHSDFLDKLEILLACPDPAGNLWKIIAPLHTFVNGISVLFAVQKKFAGADHSVWPAQSVQVIVNFDDLLCGIGRSRLLSITKSGVRDPDILGHIMRHDPVIERYLWHLRIREHIPEHIGLFDIIQYVHMLFNLKQVVLRVQ